MIGIDTNILLRLLLADEPRTDDRSDQFALANALISNDEEAFYINHVVIVETLWVLRQKAKHSRQAISTAIHSLINLANVTVQDAPAVLAALDDFSRFPCDFSDHLIGEINRRNHCRTTFTFDRAAAKAPNFTELKR